MLLLLAIACQSPPGADTGDADTGPCELLQFTTVESVPVQVHNPATPLFSDGAPVVVVVHGGIDPDVLPVTGLYLLDDVGSVQLYFNLPGSEGEYPAPGTDDLRGPLARPALAAVLRWASGEQEDDGGCLIQDRVSVDLADMAPLVHAQSHGGNLALLTLATEDVPPPSGLTTFETPASAQFITVEMGSLGVGHPDYPAGECTWTSAQGLTCPLDYSTIAWSDDIEKPDGVKGAAYFDFGEDGAYSPDTDLPVWGWEVDSGRVFSPTMTRDVEGYGIGLPGAISADDADAFWYERDASRQIASVPDLPVLVMGTDTDHMSGAPDHAHVTGLAHALMATGASWVRVNPDAAYMTAVLGDIAEWVDNPVNMAVSPGGREVDMEPDEHQTGGGRVDYSTAGVLELLERVHAGEWAVDLDERIGG